MPRASDRTPKSIPRSASAAIRWSPATSAGVAPPKAAGLLLAQAAAADPANAAVRLKLADLNFDRYDFTAATAALEEALGIDPALDGARPRLARAYNATRRHREAVAVLAPETAAQFERGLALAALGADEAAEREYRAVLASDPHHRRAVRQLSKLLRRAGRFDDLLALCEGLHAAGATNAMLLYAWGTALGVMGRHERARALLLDQDRIAQPMLPLPPGWSDHGAFNAALEEEILTNPYRLSEFPVEDEANRGSSRVHALFAGRRPQVIADLLEALQQQAEAWHPERSGAFDPWLDARPGAARLKAWGLIQRRGEYEEWHLHPGGWLSGVYYIRVPGSVSADGAGQGCIEFGPPAALERACPGSVPIRRYLPREGSLLLAPSHYAHRTIPSGVDEHRISFAFDVVPQPAGTQPAGPV